MAIKRWRVSAADEKSVNLLKSELNLSPLAARALAARGYSTPELASEFIEGSRALESPMILKDIEKAADRINAAIENEEKIAVFGDYDVDGLTSTTLMLGYLQSRGAEVMCALPERDSTGYGLSKAAIDNFKKLGASLIVTVDNGVSAHDEIAYAKSLGIDTVVCDHHLPAETLPDAYAVVDPLRSDDASSFKELAGVGVALKLAAAVEGCAAEDLMDEFGYLAAIGTVADIMPLVGENREIVKRGLENLAWCDSPGLRALCEAAGTDIEKLDAQGVAFTLSPRLNAAGRMGSAELALRLLISDDIEEAEQLARELDSLNRERQRAETEAAKQIAKKLDADPTQLRRPVIIVSGEGLHGGVIGIVCSRLVERFGKPVIIISTDNGSAKGSGRGVGGFSLHAAIASCADILQKYGGHEMAAGFMLNTSDVEEFKERIFDYCRTAEGTVELPDLAVDAEAALGELTESAVRELVALAPFGRGFEEPVFAARGLTVDGVTALGERHSRVTLARGGETLSGAWFSVKPGELPFKKGDIVDAAFSVSIYESSQRSSVSVRFRDIAPGGEHGMDFDSLSAYRALCAERELDEEQRELLALNRETIAEVYRACKKDGLDHADLRALTARFPSLGLGAALAALDVLLELGLADMKADGAGRYIVRAIEGAPKTELANSATYRALGRAPAVTA